MGEVKRTSAARRQVCDWGRKSLAGEYAPRTAGIADYGRACPVFKLNSIQARASRVRRE
jgi:hypothetical protein